MKIACAYIRVSTEYQIEYSPDSQIKLIKEYAKKNNLLLPNDLIYKDEGISGRKADKRPEFKSMLTDAKQKKFEVILIYNTSRFARNHEESIVYRSMLKREGIEVISITQPNVDPKTDILMNALYAVMDERYSLDLSENVKRGMTEKAMRGEFLGSTPYGYKVIEKKKTPVIKEEESKVVKLIFNKFTEHKQSPFTIARLLNNMGFKTSRGNQWERRGVEYILRNNFYCGFITWNKRDNTKNINNHIKDCIIKEGNHQPIISKEQFKKAQDIFLNTHTHKKSRPSTEYTHWLSGIVKCSNCGRTLSATRRNHLVYFQCNGYNKGKCVVSHSISEKRLTPSILASLKEAYETPCNLRYKKLNIVDTKSELDTLNMKLINLEKRLNRVKEAYESEVDTLEEYKIKKEKLKKEMANINDKIQTLRITDNYENDMKIDNSINNVYDALTQNTLSLEEKNAILKTSVDKIIFNKVEDTVEVFYYCN